MVREVTASASEAALNFVRDHRRVVLRGQRAGASPEFFADRENAAFALNCFQHHGADRVVEFALEVSDIVELHKFHARHQRSKRLAILFRIRNRNSAESSTMERILQSEDSSFFAGPAARRLGVRISSRQLQRSVHRFSAAVGKKHPIQAGPLRQLSRQRSLKRILKQIRQVNRAPSFAANYADQLAMRMTERVHGYAAQKIQIFAAFGIVKMAAAPSRKYNRRAPIRIHQVARLFGPNLLRGSLPARRCCWLFHCIGAAPWAAAAGE